MGSEDQTQVFMGAKLITDWTISTAPSLAFWDKVLLGSPDWHKTRDPPASSQGSGTIGISIRPGKKKDNFDSSS